MEFITKLLGSNPETAEVIAAKAKKDDITKRCAKEQTDVDKEIIDAEAKVQPVAQDVAVEKDGASPTGVSDKKTDLFPVFSSEVKPVEGALPMLKGSAEEAAVVKGSSDGGKSKKKKGGKSNKKKFSNKRKGGKRKKSQKKRH